ncbi:hypothetical protein AGMMS49975_30230 [Clostridia bacterium]|nr:hypothetical protein AGMMS49975_30230 [Clostridia bacterium]
MEELLIEVRRGECGHLPEDEQFHGTGEVQQHEGNVRQARGDGADSAETPNGVELQTAAQSESEKFSRKPFKDVFGKIVRQLSPLATCFIYI